MAVLCAALLAPCAARADADPASDVLYIGSLFLPYTAKALAVGRGALSAAIRTRPAVGKPIRVALIASAERSRRRAAALREADRVRTVPRRRAASSSTPDSVLVVMPQGAGYAKGGRLVADKAVTAARPSRARTVLRDGDRARARFCPARSRRPTAPTTQRHLAARGPESQAGGVPLAVVVIAIAVVAPRGRYSSCGRRAVIALVLALVLGSPPLPPSVHPWPIGVGPGFRLRRAGGRAGRRAGRAVPLRARRQRFGAHVELFVRRQVLIVPAGSASRSRGASTSRGSRPAAAPTRRARSSRPGVIELRRPITLGRLLRGSGGSRSAPAGSPASAVGCSRSSAGSAAAATRGRSG